MTRDFARRFVGVLSSALHRGVRRRERLWYFSELRGQRRIGLGGPGDDAAFVARCGDAYQTGEARGFATAARRTAASPQVLATGHPDAIATFMGRTRTRRRAPICSGLRRLGPRD